MTLPAVVANVAASVRFRLLVVERRFPLRASGRPGGSNWDCSAEPVRPWLGDCH